MHKNNKSDLILRYEAMLGQGTNVYFDADQFDDIATYYEINEDYNEALQVVEKALILHPGNTDLLIKKSKYLLYLDYVDQAREIINSIPNSSEEAKLIRLELHFMNGEMEQATILLEEILTDHDLTWEVCYDIISMMWDYTDYEDILKFACIALDKIPDSKELKREIAMLYEEHDHQEKAIEIYNLILDKDPYDVLIWLDIARAYVNINEFDKAIEACDFAIVIDESNENIYSLKGFCLFDIGKYEEALETFEEFSKYSKDAVLVNELKAECYTQLKRYDEAIQMYLKAIELKPDNAEIYYQLANVYFDKHDFSNALFYNQKNIDLNPQDSESYKFMAEICQAKEDYTTAIKYLNQADLLNPESEDILSLMGELQHQSGNLDLAIEYLNQALVINPYAVKNMFKLIMIYSQHENSGNKSIKILLQIENMIENINSLENISDENKQELMQAKEIITKLKKILRENLDTNIK